jgi:hypothetical protein
MAQLAIANDARKRIDGVVIDRSDLGYDSAREVWNRLYEGRPALIVRPKAMWRRRLRLPASMTCPSQ